ncbi:halocyanin domain-containing protein [Halobacteriales archaeon QS_4_69_34]|nr:MAG: halocyanin domain-containing protein [Halobacteriales archaeon QS_4_69_34]
MKHDRRRFLRLGGLAAAGVLAGCTGGGGDGGSGGDGDGGGGESGETATAATTEAATDAPATTEAATAGGEATGEGTTGGGAATGNESTGGGSGGQAAVKEWLSDTDNYGGTVEDLTGGDAPTVAVGASGNGGNFAFDPAAIRVSTGTAVEWQWTGEGGAHNVVAQEGAFTSGDPQEGGSVTYEHTFEEAGTFLYYCKPHRGLGMKGAVVVEG